MMILFRRRIQRYRCGGGCTSKSGKHFTQPLVATTCEMGFRLKTIFSQLHTLPRWPDSDSCKESDRSRLNRGKVDVISSYHGHFHRIRIGFGVLAVGTCGCKTVVLARPPLAEASTRPQSHRPCRPSQLRDFGQPHPPRGSKRSDKEPVEVSDLPYRQRAAPRRILPPNQQQRARQLSQLAIPSDGSPSSPRRARSPGLRALRQLRPKRNGRSGVSHAASAYKRTFNPAVRGQGRAPRWHQGGTKSTALRARQLRLAHGIDSSHAALPPPFIRGARGGASGAQRSNRSHSNRQALPMRRILPRRHGMALP